MPEAIGSRREHLASYRYAHSHRPPGTTTDVILQQATEALSLIGVRDNGRAIINRSEDATEYGAILVPASETEKATAELKRRGIRAFAD